MNRTLTDMKKNILDSFVNQYRKKIQTKNTNLN